MSGVLLAGALTLAAGCASSGSSTPAQERPSRGPEAGEFSETQLVGQEAAEIPVTRKRWRYAAHIDGQLIETPHYEIYTTVNKPSFTDQLPMFFELALDHYSTALGKLPRPRGRLTSYLFANRRQWEGKTKQMLEDQATVFSTLGRGGFTTGGVSVLFYIDYQHSLTSRDTFAIAAHEGWHQYSQKTFNHLLPVWLEEGVATYMEGFSIGPDGEPRFEPADNRERRDELREATFEGRLIPVQDLLARTPQEFLSTGKNQLLTYYAQVWALTRFVAETERYRPEFERVLRHAAYGRLASTTLRSPALSDGQRREMLADPRTGPWIVLAYFNPDLDAFAAEYRAFIDEIVKRR